MSRHADGLTEGAITSAEFPRIAVSGRALGQDEIDAADSDDVYVEGEASPLTWASSTSSVGGVILAEPRHLDRLQRSARGHEELSSGRMPALPKSWRPFSLGNGLRPLYLRPFGIAVNGATIYSTMQPCFGCAKELLQAEVMRVVYLHPWSPTDPEPEMERAKKAEYEKLFARLDTTPLAIVILAASGP